MTTIKYEPVIGLEIHAELLTSSKMFCSCSAVYSASSEPNTLICPVCTGLPGAMPVVNERAVELAVLVGLALNCSINETNSFARKNYFYPDLPKGYQISQYDLPVALGWLAGNPRRFRKRVPAGQGAACPSRGGYRQAFPSWGLRPGGLQPGRRALARNRLRAGYAFDRGRPGLCHENQEHPALPGCEFRGYGKGGPAFRSERLRAAVRHSRAPDPHRDQEPEQLSGAHPRLGPTK